ncbi:hypothetical protein KCU93_g361, partial [Aureobasidium melanogenum]
MPASLNPSDFGYDHDKRLNASELAAMLVSEFDMVMDVGTKKKDMLVILEKAYALRREADNSNDKEYLEEGFDPNSRSVTMPMLRQILSQYDISYAKHKSKGDLVKIFNKNLSKLRELNNVPAQNETPPTMRQQQQVQTESNNPFRQRSMTRNSVAASSQQPQQHQASGSQASQSSPQSQIHTDAVPFVTRSRPSTHTATAAWARTQAASSARQSRTRDPSSAAPRPPVTSRMTSSRMPPRHLASSNSLVNPANSTSPRQSAPFNGRGRATLPSGPTENINTTVPLFMAQARWEAVKQVSTLISKDGSRALQLAGNGMLEETIDCLTKLLWQCSAFVDQCTATEMEDADQSALGHVKREGSFSNRRDLDSFNPELFETSGIWRDE